MKKYVLILSFFVVLGQALFAQNLATKSGKVSFHSSTPIEDIQAVSNKLIAVLAPAKMDIAFQVSIKSFTFANGLMQEHFNENYMESEKYPHATFKGTIQPVIDLTKDGNHEVSATGNLTVHGVTKQRTISGKIYVKEGKARLISNFDVACADHNIKIPTLVITKIAEVVKVSIDATLVSLKK